MVANAPQSNVITSAEHTMALLALARNVPQAHASLTSGHWERWKFSHVELTSRRWAGGSRVWASMPSVIEWPGRLGTIHANAEHAYIEAAGISLDVVSP